MQTTMTRTPQDSGQAFLSDRQVAERYSVSRQTPWGWLKKDTDFPKPVSLSPGCTRWRLTDLEAWEIAQNTTQK
jgi:prophage regulatory protein